jgi:hypothetical protein
LSDAVLPALTAAYEEADTTRQLNGFRQDNLLFAQCDLRLQQRLDGDDVAVNVPLEIGYEACDGVAAAAAPEMDANHLWAGLDPDTGADMQVDSLNFCVGFAVLIEHAPEPERSSRRQDLA